MSRFTYSRCIWIWVTSSLHPCSLEQKEKVSLAPWPFVWLALLCINVPLAFPYPLEWTQCTDKGLLRIKSCTWQLCMLAAAPNSSDKMSSFWYLKLISQKSFNVTSVSWSLRAAGQVVMMCTKESNGTKDKLQAQLSTLIYWCCRNCFYLTFISYVVSFLFAW